MAEEWRKIRFLSTPSARRATQHWRDCQAHYHHFYPRPPRGGRRCAPVLSRELAHISIHALREEGDQVRIEKDITQQISIHALREEGDSSCQPR